MNKVFRFNKGDTVPTWVQHVVATRFGFVLDMVVTFGASGKLFMLDSGDLVAVPVNGKPEVECILHINERNFNSEPFDINVNGAGDNLNNCYLHANLNSARKMHGIKNKAKCELVPLSDPRVRS